jgi:hypothetical protein
MSKFSPQSEPKQLPWFVLHRLHGCRYSENAKTLLDDLLGDGYKDNEYDTKTRIDMDNKYQQKWSSWPKVTFVDNFGQELIIGGYDDLALLIKSIRTIVARDTILDADIDKVISSITVVRKKWNKIHYKCLVLLTKAILRQINTV